MNNIVDYGLREAYNSMKSMDKLAQVDLRIPGIPCCKERGYTGAYCKNINATMDRKSSPYNWTGKEKYKDNGKTFSRIEIVFRHERDHEWRPYLRHHGEKVQGQGNVSLPWLQYAYHDHTEKTG